MQPVSKSKAIIGGKCPKCRQGKMFPGSVYGRGAFRMPERCEHCGFKFEIQPGFFWGAMFMSYALVVAIFTVESLIMSYYGVLDTIWLYIVCPVTVIVLLPVLFRVSRILFLHLFGGIKYAERSPE